MKVVWVLLGLSLLLELSAGFSQPFVELYGRRNSRMSSEKYTGEDDDDDVEDDEDDGDDDEQDDEAIYPPDFSKLFPNPDGRPVGPNSQHSYPSQHPTQHQHGRPSFGPAKIQGPAALRGPIQAQHGLRQGGMGQHRQYGAAARRHSTSPPRAQYRYALPTEGIHEGKPQEVRHTYGSYITQPSLYPYPTVALASVSQFDPWTVPVSRAHGARLYNPWHNPARADGYNPQFVFNPSEMRARRRFRYHPSQIVPSQRIPIYSGTWGNPRNFYVSRQTGSHYTSAPYWSPFM